MDSFDQRKKDILSKNDKSSRGVWDERILKVCNEINSLKDYYTTSSCSGRIMVLKDLDKKKAGLFGFVSHEVVELETFLKEIQKLKNFKEDFKFKQESVILHVACRDLENAKLLLEKSKLSGFKNSGIISLEKNIVVEIKSTEKIDFPLIRRGDFLVGKKFLEIVITKANHNLRKGWKKIERLEEFL
jgi:tRNA wybutosine-synthesizing protein 3